MSKDEILSGNWSVIEPSRTGGALGDSGDRGIRAKTSKGYVLIAEVFQDGNSEWTKDRVSLPTAQIASLASAAPELFSELKYLVSVIENGHGGSIGPTDLDRAKAALLKAQGRAE